ncbi:MAG: NAD(P)/FAD-dependent oxidoreductase [Flavobacterium sp.]|nr:MAG: NAD(P)/FAD-dependent oxidoreductase [Flavobacterium sp.]
MKTHYDVLVIGGGAAGFFTAINTAEMNPGLKIGILERGKEVLTKVKVSGGGRCNVTHAEFIPDQLVAMYPRGEKELLGPFHRFMTGDTIEWFEQRGVALKTEEDGRMFPVSDSSQSIIDVLLNETNRLGVDVLYSQPVRNIHFTDDKWNISTISETFYAPAVVMSTGSNPKIWQLLKDLGHKIVPPVPSLFTFNIKDQRISGLAGISAEVSVEVLDENEKAILASEGPLLITHWGMSGPAILKLSAWGARLLEPLKYYFTIKVNWLNDTDASMANELLRSIKFDLAKKRIAKAAQFGLAKRLWRKLVEVSGIDEEQTWADLTKDQQARLIGQLTASTFRVKGKSTFKEEFVTAGGVELKEVNFKTFESKLFPGMYFAGEILNIDAITGGFNFQNAWTGGFLAARAIAEQV